MAAPELIVGLMSGTSLDGVDAVLVDFSGAVPVLCANAYHPYPAELREHVFRLHQPGQDDLHQAAMLANRLVRLYAEAVLGLLHQANVPAAAVRAIGCHGQTVRHLPQLGYTLQLNNPSLLAELTGITVVADFRSRDIAAGGQGAPLVPAFHAAQFRDDRYHRVILNLGGIANLTDLAPGKATAGFDCGPGNMLLDAWAERHLGRRFDEGGAWAAQGRILPVLLKQLLSHEFFALPPPKSCGREQFNLAWLEGCLSGDEAAADVQATLAALTAAGVQQAVRQWCGRVEEIYVCGGGAHNAQLLKQIENMLPQTVLHSTDTLGLAADWVEAVAFAWLARRTLAGQPGNLPEVTGASGLRVLGGIYPK
ncbi:MAG: anhydro-N-acetylmuramic acid kinase [Proteobacteria bacterium]|nr:anhydro-N-acetylmuramic acid kinase [Pseudomonadota bacterium]